MNEPKPWLANLAARLRALQDAVDMPGKELAERLGWHPSRVTRIRKGVVNPSREDLEAWARAVGATDAIDELMELRTAVDVGRRTFREAMAQGQAKVQRDYNQLVEESEVIRYFETVWIPGFVQTRDYARAAFLEMLELHHPVDDVDEAVDERMKRQHLLTERGRHFDLLIAEPALLWDWVPARVMIPQLRFLATWLNVPTVRLGILPMRGGNRRVPQNSFQMYDDLVIVETFSGDPDEHPTEVYAQVMDEMWERAAVDEGALALITRAIETWES